MGGHDVLRGGPPKISGCPPLPPPSRFYLLKNRPPRKGGGVSRRRKAANQRKGSLHITMPCLFFNITVSPPFFSSQFCPSHKRYASRNQNDLLLKEESLQNNPSFTSLMVHLYPLQAPPSKKSGTSYWRDKNKIETPYSLPPLVRR